MSGPLRQTSYRGGEVYVAYADLHSSVAPEVVQAPPVRAGSKPVLALVANEVP